MNDSNFNAFNEAIKKYNNDNSVTDEYKKGYQCGCVSAYKGVLFMNDEELTVHQNALNGVGPSSNGYAEGFSLVFLGA